jgi:hypothetical protein
VAQPNNRLIGTPLKVRGLSSSLTKMKILLLVLCVASQLLVGGPVGGNGAVDVNTEDATATTSTTATTATNGVGTAVTTETTFVSIPPAASSRPLITSSRRSTQSPSATKVLIEKSAEPTVEKQTESQSSKSPSTTSIITITATIGGVILLSIIGIYIFRKTTLRKSNAFEKRLDPSYAPTLKSTKSISKFTIPKLDDYIQGRVPTPPPQIYNNTVGYGGTVGYNTLGSAVGYNASGNPAYQAQQQFHHGQTQYPYQEQGY